MSRIYFHSINGEAELRGSERAHFNVFCSDVTWAIVRYVAEESMGNRSILRNVFPPDHYALRGDNFSELAALYFRVGDDPVLLGEKKVDLFTLILNTALYLGSDSVKLGARLHGQCEIHAYVEGPNRKWLAGIIRRGREFNFFRDGEGWESVIKLLEKDDGSPIVTSYSVCDRFPNAEVANYDIPLLADGEKDWDAWDILSNQEQWDMGMIGLKKSGGWLEMKPENWNNYHFGDGMDANQFVTELRELYSMEG